MSDREPVPSGLACAVGRHPVADRIVGVARGVASFWALLIGLDLMARCCDPSFDATTWWVDLRPFPVAFVQLALVAGGLLMLGFVLRPHAPPSRRRLTVLALSLAVAATLADGTRFLLLLSRGALRSGFPVPLSFLVAMSLGLVLLGVALASRTAGEPARGTVIASFLACAVGFPLAQMLCFGLTDYRRPADVAVVFGARAYADGSPSHALADRVRAACALYHEGLVRHLVFSGGPGDGRIHETEAMRRLAVSLGVPVSATVLDPSGVSTEATVRGTVPILHREGWTRVLAVSHFYHLPRIRMCYQAAGREVFTVPAPQQRTLRQLPWLLVREVAALWAYYLRAVVSPLPDGR